MGYFNIIDSLKNSRIEEGMMTSIQDYLADNINSDGFRAYKVDKSTMEISFFL